MRTLVFSLVLATTGCASVTVTPINNQTGSIGKQLKATDSGVRFYRPALHIWITESAPPEKVNVVTQTDETTTPNTQDSEHKNTQTNQGTASEDTTTTRSGNSVKSTRVLTASTINKVYTATFMMLPDYSQEYIIQWKPGIGSVTPSFTLADGWNLTGFASTIDSKLSEFVTSLAAAGGAGLSTNAAFKGPGLYRMKIDSSGKISLGEMILSLN
jgi:hypothetical protein